MHSTRLFTAVALGATMAAGLTHADAAQPRETPMPTSATVTIYTTAQDTGQRLSQTGYVAAGDPASAGSARPA